MMCNTVCEFQLASPLISISLFSILLLMLDAFVKSKKLIQISAIGFLLAFVGISLNGLNLAMCDVQSFTYAGEHLAFSKFSYVFDALFGLAGVIALLSAGEYNAKGYKNYKEYYSIVLLSITGMVTIAHANSLLMLFLGVELMSLMFYVLAGFFRNRLTSLEASLKYFFLGSFASAFLLFGIAFIFGSTGNIYFNHIAEQFVSGGINHIYYAIGMGLITIGLAFKVAAFPFHQWAPDVYFGSPTVSAGFLSTAGKVAALSAFVVIFKQLVLDTSASQNLLQVAHLNRDILAYISAATMIIGNLTALSQSNVKRMLAYSSVAHAGYILMGIVANNQGGYEAVMYYSIAYIFMQAGAFAILATLECEGGERISLDDFKGLHSTQPVLAAIMTCFMLSLAGIPPFGGFFGKYFLFINAMNAGYAWLTIVAVIASIISMYFYIRVILNMYFKANDNPIQKQVMGLSQLAIAICIIGIIAIGIYPNIIHSLVM